MAEIIDSYFDLLTHLNDGSNDELDNSDLSYSGKSICLRLNDDTKRNKIKTSENILCKRFPKLKEIPFDNRMQIILEGLFPEGMPKQMYIRNLTYTGQNGYDVRKLGIRPKRTHADFLEPYVPKGTSLLFKGHISNKDFIIDAIYEAADTEQLDFEVDVVATPYFDQNMIRGGNFLYDILKNASSLTEYTRARLQEWKEYLKWKNELAIRQIYGCKYYKLTLNEEKRRLVFWLVFDSKEEFSAFRKYLSRDIQAFDNSYSNDRWRFDFASDANTQNQKKQRFNSVEVGRYRGIVSEYYLTNNTDDLSGQKKYVEDINVDIESHYDEDGSFIKNYNSGELYHNDEESITEDDICKEFGNPYIVQAAYDLSRRDIDEINGRNLDDDEAIQYIKDYVMHNYKTDGFLALSAVGEFVLINRFQQAIAQLERDECYSPNLSMWLFDVEKARIPDKNYNNIIINKWLNPNIEKNENQKNAVRKMIAAPDLCLIQGPPGTGKTTVIAEAIYQFVRNGFRVLVASQSNDAVDNALGRLADSPEIRAIRLGQNSRKKTKIDDISVSKFSEDEALKYYYRALSLQVSKNWLDKWDSIENSDLQYDKDIRDARLFNEDIASLNVELSKMNDENNLARKIFYAINEELTLANKRNYLLENNKNQYRLAVDCFDNRSSDRFYLPEDMIRVFEQVLNPIVEETVSAGIKLVPNRLDLAVMGLEKEQTYIYMIAKNLEILEGLANKMKESNQNSSSNDAEIIILKSEIDEAKQKMSDCFMNDDDDGAKKWKAIFNERKLRMDKLGFSSSNIDITCVEKNILSEELEKKIGTGKCTEIIATVESTIDKWRTKIKEAFREIENNMKNNTAIDVSEILAQKNKAESRLLDIKDRIKKINDQIRTKQYTLLTLMNKYKIKEISADKIIEHITELKNENHQLLQDGRGFRDTWEETLRTFKQRLDDQDAYKYDQEHYQKTYIKACNVVGISCTDNMRNLTDNEYNDFDVVIIDEVSKATPPELLIPLMKARKAILVGDHRQLPPMFKEHEGSYKELVENQDNIPEEVMDLLTPNNFKRFQKMVTSSLFKTYFEKADERIKHSLLVQYRMHSDIMGIINRFYEHKLTSGLSEEEERQEKNHGLTIKGVDGSTFIIPDRHAYWIDSSVTPSNKPIYEVRPNNSTSNYNVLEKFIVLELLKKIAYSYSEQGYNKNNRKSVGVISFYQMQVNELREAFRDAKKSFDFSSIDVDINTVDRFQGKEKSIIITCLVRNNKAGKASQHIVAFERINVAFSRAQDLLIIVGAKHMYENQEVQLPNMDKAGFKTVQVYKNIMDELYRNGCFKTSNKIITPQIEEEVIREYNELGGKQ